jgi:adenine-specific DNA-methyltransferase
MNENSLKKFQDLLRTLFQFECADLDFGIYRILNYKRSQVEAFITERLPQVVEEAFAQYAAADRVAVDQELEQKRQEIVKTLGEQAIDESGQLRNYHKTKLGQQYLLLLEKRVQYQVAEDLKTRVYNDLFTFFSRYYEDGDFVSKHRYGRHETYAIPYNGEEVVLHWANRDQYYVKTGDQFKTYRFKAGDYAVTFELRNVAPEQNGNGGKKRYSVLAHEAPVTRNEQEKVLAIAFEYRPLTEAEEKEHGRTEQQKPQDSLNEAAEKKIFGLVAEDSLKVALAKPEGTNGWSLLHKHLTRFTRRNTADFFIHKDLRGFLHGELDFFIKNEVLLLDELIAGGEKNLREHVQRGQVVRQVAEAIIEFLVQVEDFQKKLWEKRKFVVRTEYCLTIDRVPEELWEEVVTNKAQIAEWHQLYSIDGKVNKGFLKAHPTLVVDTRHFPEDFKWRLLAHFGDLDEALDGVLIKSENWQALNLLLEKYWGKIKCIYIDPPFNTSEETFLYKNNYKHSSWIGMIADRVKGAADFMNDESVLCVAIDDYEHPLLASYLRRAFGEERHLSTVVARTNPHGRAMASGFSQNHEYALFFEKGGRSTVGRLPRGEERLARYPESDVHGNFAWINFRKTGAGSKRTDRPKLFYPIYVSGKADIRIPSMTWSKDNNRWDPTEPTRPGESIVLPIDADKSERVWNLGWKRAQEEAALNLVARRVNGEWQIYRKYRPKQEGALPGTWWEDAKYSATESGTRVIKELFGEREIFSYPKSVFLVEDCLRAANCSGQAFALDYFAGSGTTAHAVINLNRQDGGKRKYIMVEVGDWFETVMLPRIKKVVFCEKWKDGKPHGGPGVSHLLKYEYLEQYEDTLNNLELPRAAEGQKMLELFGDEYLLKYMLDFETQDSASLLNLSMFKDPFAYKLKVQEGNEIVECPVDLVETFNYLLGIQVRKMQAFQDNGRPYRAVLGEKNDKRVAIIWRSVVGLEDNEEALMKDKDYIENTVLPALLVEAKPDRLLVNGACFVKDTEAIEPEFKRLMFSPSGV